MNPPSIHMLMLDPMFVRFMKSVPTLPDNLVWGHPWEIRALTPSGRWASRRFETYRDGWSMFVKAYRDPDKFTDVVIVSRRKFFGPPPHFVWDPAYTWCPRCRRPSTFTVHDRPHPALKLTFVPTTDDPESCFYCGQRRAAIPRYQPHHGNDSVKKKTVPARKKSVVS